MKRILVFLVLSLFVFTLPLHSGALPLLKVGFVAPLTGVFAPTGRDLLDGYTLYLEQTKQRWGGRGVVLIQEDDQLNPGIALTKVRKLAESDRVELLTGIISAAAAYAMRDYIDQQAVPSGAQSFRTTRPPRSSNVRWKPPIHSCPNAKSSAMVATRR